MSKAKGPLFAVHFRRRREGRTDYQKRLALLKSHKPRLVVRKTLRAILAQVVKDSPKGDVVIASADSRQLSGFGFVGGRNTHSAYLTGLLVGKKAAKAGVKDFVLDIGLHAPTKGSVVFACCKGAIDAGLVTPYSEEAYPTQERLEGAHVKKADAVKAAKLKILSG